MKSKLIKIISAILLFSIGYFIGSQKPHKVIVKTKVVYDKCICIKCAKKFHFQDVQFLIQKTDSLLSE